MPNAAAKDTGKDKVAVKLSHPYDGHTVGDRIELAPLNAKRLVQAGYATFASKADADAAGAS